MSLQSNTQSHYRQKMDAFDVIFFYFSKNKAKMYLDLQHQFIDLCLVQQINLKVLPTYFIETVSNTWA